MALATDAVIAITGASSGIGAAVARRLAGESRRLVLVGRNERRLQEIASALPNAQAHRVDVADRDQLERLFDAIPAPDVWVNNAGLARGQAALDATAPDDLDIVIDTNLKGAMHASRLAMKAMRTRGEGHIVNVTSAAAFNAYRGGHAYAISKAGLHMLTQCLRHDLGGTPIRVTEIAPGIVGDTDFSARRHDGDLSRFNAVYEGVDCLAADDVADAVHFCVSAPRRVNIELMLIYPVQQHGGSGVVHRRRATPAPTDRA